MYVWEVKVSILRKEKLKHKEISKEPKITANKWQSEIQISTLKP